ncbi:MAG: SPOR domain-containing protein [Acidiferrobacterales bacterium]
MARRSDGETDFSAKHRIVGAIIVVSLAVIFLPMILSDKPQQPPLGKAASELSEIPEPATETKVLQLPAASLTQVKSQSQAAAVTKDTNRPLDTTANMSDKPAGNAAAKQDGAIPSSNPAQANRPLKELAREEVAPKPSASETTQAAAKPVSADTPKGWVVQVGTFSDNTNAERLRDQLRKSGFLVNLEGVKLKGAKAVRVRVGPYRQKHVALKAQSEIEQQVGLKGVVLAYP